MIGTPERNRTDHRNSLDICGSPETLKGTMSKIKERMSARKMPACYHTMPGQEFAHDRSQVLAWLSRQPEIQNRMFEELAACGAIVFDPATRMWRGADVPAT